MCMFPALFAMLLLKGCCLFDFYMFMCKDGWESRWVKSDWKRSEGKAGSFKHTAGKWSADPDDKGLCFTSVLWQIGSFIAQKFKYKFKEFEIDDPKKEKKSKPERGPYLDSKGRMTEILVCKKMENGGI